MTNILFLLLKQRQERNIRWRYLIKLEASVSPGLWLFKCNVPRGKDLLSFLVVILVCMEVLSKIYKDVLFGFRLKFINMLVLDSNPDFGTKLLYIWDIRFVVPKSFTRYDVIMKCMGRANVLQVKFILDYFGPEKKWEAGTSQHRACILHNSIVQMFCNTILG